MNDFHLKLIKRLEAKLPEEELVDLLNEIGETQEPIFITSLIEAYNKYKNSSFSHIIISTIGKIDSPQKISFANNLLKTKSTQIKDLPYALKIIKDGKYYEPDSIEILIKRLRALLKITDSLHRNFIFNDLLSYFENAQKLDIIDNCLPKIFKDRDFGPNIRKDSLKYWILNAPTERIEYLSKNYNLFIKNKNLEEYLVKVCTRLEENYAEQIMGIIQLRGSTDIQNTLQYYQNLIPVNEILSIRKKINSIARDGIIGREIFIRDENFHEQKKPATSENEFKGKCTSLRGSLITFNSLLKYHNLDKQTIKEVLPSIKESQYNKGINSFVLYLYSKGIKVSEEVSRLRKLHHLLSIILHPELDKDKILNEFNLWNTYQSKEWEILHYKILKIYLLILKEIYNKIELNPHSLKS